MAVDNEAVAEILPEHRVAIEKLWSDPGVQKCFSLRRQFQISDSAKLYVCPSHAGCGPISCVPLSP